MAGPPTKAGPPTIATPVLGNHYGSTQLNSIMSRDILASVLEII
jgi:hypothetical protein